MQRPLVAALGVILAVAAAVAAYLYFSGSETEPEPAPPPAPVAPVVEEPPPAPPMVLPPLDDSDATLLNIIEGLSAHPRLTDIADIPAIARTFVEVVVAVNQGVSPRAALQHLEPSEDFAVAERERRVVIDPANFERYTWITGVFSSLDSTGVAEAYFQLEPLFDEAYRDLGYPEGGFRAILDGAMNRLASTPVPEGYVEVRRGSVFWEFRDPALEALSPPQKQLLRMGPANARLVQSKLREIQAALGR